MRFFTTTAQFAILGTFVAGLHAKEPVLKTPGTATWTTEATAGGGTRTVFTLTKNTVFDWEQLNLSKDSELVFNFKEGETVVNFLGGTGTHYIDGAVTSNGIVAFFSPTAGLEINGSIIAKGVTLATLNADADEFSSGKGYTMSGPAGFNYLTINGQVEATDGDVVLGGESVYIDGAAKIKASQDVLIGGGRELSVAASGDRRLKEKSGFGFVLHTGETGGNRIEVAAGADGISNQGTFNAGKGRIFLEVGTEGTITNESSGVIVGDLVFNGNFHNDGKVLGLDDGDIAAPVGDSTLTVPPLSRPDGTKVNSEPRTFNVTNPMSASSDAGRDSNGGRSISVASVASLDGGKQIMSQRGATFRMPVSATSPVRQDSSDSKRAEKRMAQRGAAKLMLQRSSFFGMRGGKTAITKR